MKKYFSTILLGALLAISSVANAQSQQVLKGRVVNSEGEPVVGAVVNVAEQSRIAVTDDQGYFTLKKVTASDEICVKCLGYLSAQEKVTTFDGTYKIVLKDDLDEYAHTMPIPFGRKEKKLMTEATSVVTGEELQKHPVTILQNAFTSTLNGMETYEWSSEPGWSETAMYIRGIRTMNENARAPLVIVDNVERDLSFLDAFPIENITVLKDAAATAIYGMRGANGVIMVTTKRGEAGKTHIDFTQEFGFNRLTNYFDNQNAYNQALTRNRVKYLSGEQPMYSDYDIEQYRKVTYGEPLEGMDKYRYFNTNWADVLFRSSAPTLRTNLQISGGNNTARYYVSFSYLRQEGMWNTKGTDWNSGYSTQHTLDRWNLRSNIDIDVTKYLNVSLDLGGRIDNIVQPTASVFGLTTFGMVEANPMEPVYCPDGSLYWSTTSQNPLFQLGSSGQEKNKRRNLYSTVNITGDLGKLLPGLKANALISFDAYETFESTQTNSINAFSYDYTNRNVNSVEDFTYTQTQTYSALTNPSANQRTYAYNLNFKAGLSYNHTFGKHGIDAQAFLRTYRNEVSGSDNQYARQESAVRFLSWNGQLTYNYDKRYVASFNLSHMGNDNFAPDNRWDTFWGISGAWVASEESFIKKLKFADLLKLRMSYGKSGQAYTGSGRYPYQSTFSGDSAKGVAYYGFGYNPTGVGFAEIQAGNSNNIWEVSKMFNIGLDFDFFHKKIYGSFDWFKEWRSQILVNRSTVPAILGVPMAKDSYGKAESHGYELVLGHRNSIGKHFKYYIEGQLTYNTNKITEMDETAPDVEWQRKTGRRIYDNTSVAALYESAFNNTVGGWNIFKFDQWASNPDLIATSKEDAIAHPEKYPYNDYSGGNQPLGTAVFQDLNGDRVIDSKDMSPDSYTIIPEIIPSINVGFELYGFDARAVFTGYLNRSVFLSPSVAWSAWGSHATHEVVNCWGYYTDDPTDSRNVNARYPRPFYSNFNAIDSDRDTGTYQNDIWVINGNFWSLRNIEIGYSLPQKWISKLSMTKCRIYFNAYNMATWSSKIPDGLDPEKPMGFCWWYPKTRTYTFGINIGF